MRRGKENVEKDWVLSIYHLMHVQIIVFYIEMNMQTKRYVENVCMTGTRNPKTMVKHMVVLIKFYDTCL